MTETRLKELIKKLKYKTYVSSKELQEIRLEINSYLGTDYWESIFSQMRLEGVAHYVMPRMGLAGESLLGKNALPHKGSS